MVLRLDFAVVVSTALGLALCTLCAASLGASLIALPHDKTFADMRRHAAVVEPAAAAAAMDAGRRAAAWADGCRHLTNAALASAYVPGALSRTGELSAAALKRCPASPHNWLRLAIARERRGDVEGARAAWSLAVLTGRHSANLQAQGVELGLRLVAASDAEFLELLGGQVRAAAAYDVEALAGAAIRTRTSALVRVFLRDKPHALDAFDRATAI